MTKQDKPLKPSADPGAAAESPPATPRPHRVEVQGRLSARFEALGSRSLLQAALAQGVALPSSCRNGTCRACICKLESGEIAYRIEWPGLSREEKSQGWILPCVAEARSDLRLQLPSESLP